MSLKQRSPQWLAVVGAGLLAMGTTALAQPATNYEPKSGQPGKDVVWVPTPQSLVDRMLDMAKATPQDYVIDLGSGDGRTVITAAKRGIKAHGIEYNPDLAELAKRNAVQAGVTDKATFAHGDIFESDFSQATVVTLFLLPGLNVRLRPTLLDMKAGTRVVSNSFTMGDWEPDELGCRYRGLQFVLQGLPVDRAGQSRRKVADGPERARDRSAVPGVHRHAQNRQRDCPDHPG